MAMELSLQFLLRLTARRSSRVLPPSQDHHLLIRLSLLLLEAIPPPPSLSPWTSSDITHLADLRANVRVLITPTLQMMLSGLILPLDLLRLLSALPLLEHLHLR